jgi:hypothetical protein
MQAHELEEVMLKLSGAYEATKGKKITKQIYDFWAREVFSGNNFDVCMRSIRECALNPDKKLSPDEVSDFIKKNSAQSNEESQGFIYAGNCPESLKALKFYAADPPKAADNIADAFRMYHKLIYGNTGDKKEMTTKMTQQEALEIVNKIAAKNNSPESIEPKYRIDSYFQKGEL